MNVPELPNIKDKETVKEADFCFPLSAYGLDKGLHLICTVFLYLFGHMTGSLRHPVQFIPCNFCRSTMHITSKTY